MELQPKTRILIIRLSAIGDVARTLSAVSLLRKESPHAYICWVVEEKSKPVLEGDPTLNKVILFPRKKFTQLSRNPKNWLQLYKEWRQFVKHLKEEKFDITLDFHGIFKSGLIAYVSGAPKRFGYKRKFVKEWNWLFNNHKMGLESSDLNRYDRNRALIAQWVPSKTIDPTPIYISLTDQEKITTLLAELRGMSGNSSKAKCVILHPGASKPHKRWLPEKFAQLATQLIETEKVLVILTWGPGEKELAHQIKSMIQKEEAVFMAPELSLKQFAELTSRVDLFVSSDSGPMHIAATMQANQIALFGPTDPRVNDPHNPNATLIKAKNFKDLQAMETISVNEVLQAARLKLMAR